MKIIRKYYNKHGKLRLLRGSVKKESFIRLKVTKGNEWSCCDWHGTCTNKAYAEVYPFMLKKNKGWSYLCKKHYYQEEKNFKWKLPACLKVEW